MRAKELHISKNEFWQIIKNRTSNDTIYVSVCELGLCINAKKEIRKGDYIFTFHGHTINFLETKRRGEQECMPIQFASDTYIDTEAPGKYINHSCEPNAGIINGFDLIALEDITMHSEIRFDYSTTMDENSYTMKCECGKPSCRKIIRDFRFLPLDTRERYLKMGIVMDFIKIKYSRAINPKNNVPLLNVSQGK